MPGFFSGQDSSQSIRYRDLMPSQEFIWLLSICFQIQRVQKFLTYKSETLQKHKVFDLVF